ncbi:MAG: LysE family translocator [Roseobacter sp.]
MLLDTYLLYLAAVAVFFATPPDTSQLLIVSNSIRYGLRKSVFTIAGDLSANALQMTAAAFGLAAVIATSATLFFWIKWLGVAYLLWIGVQMIRSSDQRTQTQPAPARARLVLFRQGFVTSLANPFAVVFFAALFPQFIDPSLPVLPQLLILGGTYLVVDGAILVLWGLTAQRAVRMLQRVSFARINQLCGALMIAAAALLASKEIAPSD